MDFIFSDCLFVTMALVQKYVACMNWDICTDSTFLINSIVNQKLFAARKLHLFIRMEQNAESWSLEIGISLCEYPTEKHF